MTGRSFTALYFALLVPVGVGADTRYRIEEIRLGHLPESSSWWAYSDDGWHFACVTSRGDRELVVLDGVEKAAHEEVVGGSLVFSPDGKRLAYRVYDPQTNKSVVVVDGVQGREYDGIVSLNAPTFHEDGVLEYLAIRDNTLYRVRHVPIAAAM